jgi:DNA-directed RNA polymerase specialized sigma24 family protein
MEMKFKLNYIKPSHFPKKQQLVFLMKYFEELKYEQISEILGTSVGALKASYPPVK